MALEPNQKHKEMIGRPLKDITNKKFGRLTAIKFDCMAGGYHAKWLCRCICGNNTVVFLSSLRTGHTKSCGCLQRERTSKASITHGMSRSPIYFIWKSMRQRCLNPHDKYYKDYGGRGIKVCERWSKFDNFLKDMGPRPEGKQLDRINNDGDYKPSNCRWATTKQQANNQRNCRQIKYKSRKITILELSEELGISYRALHRRINRNSPLLKDVEIVK